VDERTITKWILKSLGVRGEIHRFNLRIRYSCEYCEHGNKPSRSHNRYCLGNEKGITHSECRENQNTYFMFNTFFFLIKSCRV
jgi:hypothetical protein